MSIRNLGHTSPSIPDNLLDVLGPGGVKILLKLIRDAYFDLCQKNIVTISMSENEITEELFICIQKRWRSEPISLIPFHEKQDKSKSSGRGKPPTIDFCFRHDWDWRLYFGAECKLIESNNKTLCNHYVSQGMQRYLDGKYSQKCPEGAMLGYIRQSQCDDVASELRIRINALDYSPGFDKTDRLIPFEDYYISKHKRSVIPPAFTIHHFLFSFQPQAKNK